MIPLGQPKHYAWLRSILVTTLILNVFDAGMTIYWILSGNATEANPMMETLVAYGPFPLMAGKLLLVSLGSFVLWRFRRRPLAVIFIFIASVRKAAVAETWAAVLCSPLLFRLLTKVRRLRSG